MHLKHPEKFTTDKHHDLLERFCDHLLLGIEPRGDHATGFVATCTDGSTTLDKKNVPAHKWLRERKRLPKGARSVLLHTRLATKGSPSVWANNHPVFFGSVFTTHNGTIYNDDELFDHHELNRMAEVDSEVIPAMLDKYTFDKAGEAFAELGGGFATASIDPVRYPGVVVLGKGGTFPIVTFETKDFLIWASTEKVLKDAWGSCLGTPPSKGFETLSSGDVWYINGDVIDKHKSAFKHKGYSRQSSSTWSSASRGNSYADDWEDYDWENWPVRGGNRQFIASENRNDRVGMRGGTTLDLRARMAELRKTGKTSCVTYSDRTNPAAEKYLAKYGNGRWIYCRHCQVSVADPQVIKATKDWGDICIDCYALAKATETTKNTDVKEFLNDFVGMRSDDYEKLEKFADLQTYIHNQALYSVSRETGVKRTLIDWILHRADVKLLEGERTLLALYCELSDLYTEAVADLWQAWATEGEAEADPEAEDPTDPYVTCASGTHRESEADDCESCLSMACGVEPFEQGEVLFDNQLTKCMVCRRKPKAFLGTTHAWCAQHAHICHAKKCESKPVGFAPNNQRFCHTHSRGVKGFIADSDTKARKQLVERAARA